MNAYLLSTTVYRARDPDDTSSNSLFLFGRPPTRERLVHINESRTFKLINFLIVLASACWLPRPPGTNDSTETIR